MRKLLLLFASCFLLLHTTYINAQSFNVQHDTVYVIAGSDTSIENDVNNLTAGNISINWKIKATNFPSGWEAGSGICDNNACFEAPDLWPSASLHNSIPYAVGLGSYRVVLDLSSVSGVGRYLTIMMRNAAIPSDSASETYIITSAATTSIPTIKSPDEVVLYPNPARNELNIVYDASADIKNIAVYNIIGKVLTVYKVTDNNSANLNIENIPSGIYFVRLVNSHGAVVVTRKFIKQ